MLSDVCITNLLIMIMRPLPTRLSLVLGACLWQEFSAESSATVARKEKGRSVYVTGGSSDTSTHAAGDRNGTVVKVAPVQVPAREPMQFAAREPTQVTAREVPPPPPPPAVTTTTHATSSRPVVLDRSEMRVRCLSSDVLILMLLIFYSFISWHFLLGSVVVAV